MTRGFVPCTVPGRDQRRRAMRAVVQRVSRARVTVDAEETGAIGPGLLVLVGVADGDGPADVDALADKILGLRIFADDEGRMNRDVVDAAGGILVVSQFTLLADARKGRRPSFVGAAAPEVAEPLVAAVVERIAAADVPVATGRFGARMMVELVNDGPVTIVLEVRDGRVI
jgi:D-tyrosyl-tRNA(Tyr) deacylase